jgi:hypothetical protein
LSLAVTSHATAIAAAITAAITTAITAEQDIIIPSASPHYTNIA